MTGARLSAVLAIAVLGSGCRTPATDISPAGPIDGAAILPDLGRTNAAPSAAGSVICGPMNACAITDGEHCCASTSPACQTAPCQSADQFDCDGPEDCGGSPCCFPIRDSLSWASCAAECVNTAVLCHSQTDCPASTVCCGNFVLGPGTGLCLGACD